MQAPENWISLAIPLGVLTATLAAGYFSKRPLFRLLRRKAAVTKHSMTRVAIKILRKRFTFWVFMLALELAAETARLPSQLARQIAAGLLGVWILSLVIPGLRLGAQLAEDMSCAFGHHWSWPRRRAGIDTQVCSACGFERRSPIQFGAGAASQFGHKNAITA